MKIVAVGLVFGVMLALAAGLVWGLPRLRAASSADEVHSAFIAALEARDRQGALALIASERQQDLGARLNHLTALQEAGLVALRGPNSLGHFEGARALPLRESGSEALGVSIWSFQERTLCYATRLDLVQEEWKVTGWTNTACP